MNYTFGGPFETPPVENNGYPSGIRSPKNWLDGWPGDVDDLHDFGISMLHSNNTIHDSYLNINIYIYTHTHVNTSPKTEMDHLQTAPKWTCIVEMWKQRFVLVLGTV